MSKIAPFVVLIVLFLGSSNVAGQELDLEKGYEYGTKAIQGVCWYEYLKRLPDKNKKSDKFGSCYQNLSLKQTISQFEAQGVGRGDYFNIKANLPGSMNPFVKKLAPIQYSECSEYLDDPEKAYPKDYSSILNDGSDAYPFRGWAHCLIGKMEATHGNDALTTMKDKWSSESHPWMNEVLTRENENRKRHGAPPLELNKELSARAQKWADQLAEKCAPLTVADHITKDHPDAMYKDKQCGENIAMRQYKLAPPPEDDALSSADAWYEEIRFYPWPEYKGKGDDPLFGKIGHFTASMWKGTQQVGYGLGRKEGCERTYVVGRYWPGGNTPGKFAENIAPPQDE